jgi:hypothetical protein
MVVDVLESNKIIKMLRPYMAIISLKMGNFCLHVQSLKTILIIVEGEKHGLLE